MLDVFMGEEFHIYGLNVINRFIKRDDWTQSQRFPRVTLCDFQVSLVTKEILFQYHLITGRERLIRTLLIRSST